MKPELLLFVLVGLIEGHEDEILHFLPVERLPPEVPHDRLEIVSSDYSFLSLVKEIKAFLDVASDEFREFFLFLSFLFGLQDRFLFVHLNY
jgi:hypothetical protein